MKNATADCTDFDRNEKKNAFLRRTISTCERSVRHIESINKLKLKRIVNINDRGYIETVRFFKANVSSRYIGTLI